MMARWVIKKVEIEEGNSHPFDLMVDLKSSLDMKGQEYQMGALVLLVKLQSKFDTLEGLDREDIDHSIEA